jgi:hypothetical protein
MTPAATPTVLVKPDPATLQEGRSATFGVNEVIREMIVLRRSEATRYPHIRPDGSGASPSPGHGRSRAIAAGANEPHD